MVKKQFNKSSAFLATALVIFTALLVASVNAVMDTTAPTILSVSPANNEMNDARNEQIIVVFSEAMDPSTINASTILTVAQRSTPESGVYRSVAINGTVAYIASNHTATFTSTDLLSPNQKYGNVFTVTITTGAKDLTGNSLSRNYVWSFTTGGDPFNTGSTTSQSNQNANAKNGSAAAASVAPPVASVPAATAQTPATQGNFPWAWLIGGLFLLLLAVLLFPTPASQKNIRIVRNTTNVVHTRQAGRPNPFGEVRPVIDLEGIGPEYNRALKSMGIKSTNQLWEADAAKVAHATGAPLKSVQSWQHMAELSSVKDIGPQYAELLERSGIHSIEQLRSYQPNELLELVREKQDSLNINIQGNFPGYVTVENWIIEAQNHQSSESEGQVA